MSLCSELLSKPQQDRLSSASSSIVKRTLQWVLLLEEWRPVVLHKVSNTAKIARLMHVHISYRYTSSFAIRFKIVFLFLLCHFNTGIRFTKHDRAADGGQTAVI